MVDGDEVESLLVLRIRPDVEAVGDKGAGQVGELETDDFVFLNSESAFYRSKVKMGRLSNYVWQDHEEETLSQPVRVIEFG